mgnify:CR=1 FL=1
MEGVMMRNLVIILLLGLAMVGGAIWLEIFLSKKSSRWYGLILPIITFVFSLIFALNIMDTGDAWQNTISVVTTLLLTNIPTAILLAIYFASREKLKRRSQIDKMNIQDLE